MLLPRLCEFCPVDNMALSNVCKVFSEIRMLCK
jgi:hypothetical protein